MNSIICKVLSGQAILIGFFFFGILGGSHEIIKYGPFDQSATCDKIRLEVIAIYQSTSTAFNTTSCFSDGVK